MSCYVGIIFCKIDSMNSITEKKSNCWTLIQLNFSTWNTFSRKDVKYNSSMNETLTTIVTGLIEEAKLNYCHKLRHENLKCYSLLAPVSRKVIRSPFWLPVLIFSLFYNEPQKFIGPRKRNILAGEKNERITICREKRRKVFCVSVEVLTNDYRLFITERV